MSAKGRGPKLDTTGQDAYETPAEAVRALATVYRPPRGILLEPCCGNGAIIKAAPWKRRWFAWDIRASAVKQAAKVSGVAGYWVGDCATRTVPHGPGTRIGAICSNPPYSNAATIIRWALDNRPKTADVVMLMRLPWLCAKAGREWIVDEVPDVYVLSKRPSFAGKGARTDMADYGWFVWPAGVRRCSGIVSVLPKDAGK